MHPPFSLPLWFSRWLLYGRHRLLPGGLLLAALLLCPVVRAAPPLVLHDGMPPTDLWRSFAVMADRTAALTAEEALARPGAFVAPAHRAGSLGVHAGALWLRATLVNQARANTGWVVSIDHPALHQVDIYLAHEGRITQQATMGSLRPFSQRPWQSRTPAMGLYMAAGVPYELLVRVRTGGSMIVPATVAQAPAFLSAALGEQMLQGLFAGLSACLLIYSVGQWISGHGRLFLHYALLVAASMGFYLQLFGIGAQYLWRDQLWVELHIATLCGFAALATTFLFLGHALLEGKARGGFFRAMQAGAAISAVLGAAFMVDGIGTRTAMVLLSALGPLPWLMSAPVAWARARRGNPLGATLLLASATYLIAAATMAGLSQGLLPANGWTLHAFQIGTVAIMLLFMRVLGLRTAALGRAAQDARRERDAMRSLAHTDPLTGLANRRGLDLALAAAMARCTPDHLAAVYMLDLDGFKPVNDRHGHAVGDQLLVAVTARLHEHLRHTDTVARIGGDEFVVMANDLASPEQAHQLGTQLLDAFRAPIVLGALELHVGLTIGYALAPLDSTEPALLIKLADAAMYSGKQSGKFCVRRNTGDLALSSA
ncbi:diguanylate cyclase [Acidovorax sp. NCPPB 3576]|uniref:diguanylate cyclase n=1 Tax=Acidovorax sp. NCPPB 3576 TaxID=2940488 RepID=UPI00234AA36D|nr:diguanylate cyclase [Acidovorax sp. NCPPB 3576]WCM86911.1 sensor domain-containing diguanylate cyclase [Acidovorax sp. NCPPB 3576]